MRAYGQGYWEVMDLPIKTFWCLNRQVNRLRAEEDLRALRIGNVSQSGEESVKLRDDLVRELETPAIVEKKFDDAKFQELQEKFAANAGLTKHTDTKVE